MHQEHMQKKTYLRHSGRWLTSCQNLYLQISYLRYCTRNNARTIKYTQFGRNGAGDKMVSDSGATEGSVWGLNQKEKR